MAWNFDLNNFYAGGDDSTGGAFYRLKALLVSLGWTVRGSGDGLSLFEDQDEVGRGNAATGGAGTGDGGAYDVITQESGWGGGAAGDWGNENAWYRIREPGSTREFIFQRNSAFESFGAGEKELVITFSPTGFTGVVESPSATVPPTAADQYIFLGTPPGGGVNWGNNSLTGTDQIIHLAAEDTPLNGVYRWMIYITVAGNGDPWALQCYDGLVDGQVGDQQPWYWVTVAAAGIGNFNNNVRVYRDYGGGAEAQATASFVGYKDSDDSQMVPGNTPPQDDGDMRDWPIPVWDQDTQQFHGFCASLRWKGDTGNYPDVQGIATADAKLYLDDLLLPWQQNLIPKP